MVIQFNFFYCCIKTIPGLAFFSPTQIKDDLVTTKIPTDLRLPGNQTQR